VDASEEETAMPASKRFFSTTLALTLLYFGLIPTVARADFMVTASGTESQVGSIGASATFSSYYSNGQGYIKIVLTNTATGNSDPAQAVSQLFFQVANGLAAPGNVTSVSGNWINFANNTTGSVTNGTPGTYHWGNQTVGGVYGLLDVSSGQFQGGPGGKVQYMIIGSSPSVGNNLQTNFNPYFNGSATFLIADSSITSSTVLTANDITNVQFGFGTGPEAKLNGTVATPAPPSIVLYGLGGIGVAGFVIWSRRRRPAAAAS
jgi:hypothetical protein